MMEHIKIAKKLIAETSNNLTTKELKTFEKEIVELLYQ
jgi:hypothetical protein